MTAHIQETAAAVANKVTGSGVGVTVLGWATSSDFGMWAGIVIGLVGLAVNFYYKRKSDHRAAEAHRLYMSRSSLRQALDTLPPLPEIEEKDE